jgi:integrase/recombinase XerD
MTTETPAALADHRAAFLESLKIRHCSPATIESRDGSLKMFFGYMAGQGMADARDVSRQTVKDYQLWLLARQYAPMTVVSRMQAVRRFFEHLEVTGVILVNPCPGIPLPRIGNRLPKTVLTEKEAGAVLDAPDTQTGPGIRDKAILETFYSTGIRLEEMARLTIHDVDCRNGFLRVNKGKFAKDRMVPLGRKASDYVREYLQKVRAAWSQANRDERALWLSSKHPHRPLHSQMIEVMVSRYARAAGLDKKVTPHVWRHTCATHLVADGANIAYVQRLLGHRSLRTTQIYTRTTIAEIKATHAKAHPQARSRSGHAYRPAIGREGKPLLYRKGQP